MRGVSKHKARCRGSRSTSTVCMWHAVGAPGVRLRCVRGCSCACLVSRCCSLSLGTCISALCGPNDECDGGRRQTDDRQAQCGYVPRGALWVHIAPSSSHEASALRVDVSETGAGPRPCSGMAGVRDRSRSVDTCLGALCGSMLHCPGCVLRHVVVTVARVPCFVIRHVVVSVARAGPRCITGYGGVGDYVFPLFVFAS